MKPIKTFTYEGKTYTKIIPAKSLFNSTMVHEVVTRGSIFALNLDTGIFTILPPFADRDSPQTAYQLVETKESLDAKIAAHTAAEEAKKKLKAIRNEIRQGVLL